MNLNPLLPNKPAHLRPLLKKLGLLLGFLALLLPAGQAQELDPVFDSKIDGVGTDNEILVSTVLPDGKVLISGTFTRVKGVARNGIARLHPDGTLDTSFDPGSGVGGGAVLTLLGQPDGKVVLAGTFTSVSGVSRTRIARLNANGSLDAGFDPGVGANNLVNALLLQGDKIIIGGGFASVGGVARSRIARLNANGTVDPDFVGGPNGGVISSMALQPDGKIIIGGTFNAFVVPPVAPSTTPTTVTRNRIARLNSNGSLDESFDTPGGIPGANGEVRAMATQADGKIVIGGSFTTVANTSRNRIARLNVNGSLDTSFNPGTGANAAVHSVAVQADQKIVVGGLFTSFHGVDRAYLVRLSAAGSVDAGFNLTFDNTIHTVAVAPAGDIMVAGAFTSINGTLRNQIARLKDNGTVSADFGLIPHVVSYPNAMVTLPDGKILIGGPFVTVNGVERRRIARLNADGSLDSTFDPGSGANHTVTALAVQPDGKILVGGSFTQFNGGTYNRLVRLHPDGSLDATFDPGTGPDNQVAALVVQPNGHILIGGSFTKVQGITRNHLARLTPTGELDPSFDPGSGTSSPVLTLALQPDGKVVAGGTFTTVNTVRWNHIARFEPNGSLDGSFGIGQGNDTGIGGPVHALRIQSDGKILVGGNFTRALGTSVNHVVRLNGNGSLDATFNPAGAGANGAVHALALQANGKILVGGAFTTFNGTARNRVARLLANGTLDPSFSSPSTSTMTVGTLALQADHLVLVGRLAEMTADPAGRALNRLIAKEPQTITFAALPDKTYGEAAFKLTATASSGLPTSFQIVSGPATLSGDTLTLTGAGQVVVKATQAGSEAFYAATDVERGFAVAKAAQSITFATLENKTFGDEPFALAASASSHLPIVFEVVSGPATLNGDTLTITGAGTVTVKASQPGNANYLAATEVEQTLEIAKAAQTITFAALENKTFGDGPVVLTATASSGLPVTISVVSGPASLDGDTLTLTGAGEVTIRATQMGNANYLEATDVAHTFTIAKAAQTISFASLAPKTIGDSAFTLTATASSGLPVSFSLVSGPATLSGDTLTLTGAGQVIVKATQAGNENYLAATDVEQTLEVSKMAQSITFAPLEEKAFGGEPFALTASASSGLSVIFEVVSGPAAVAGDTLTLTGFGEVTVRASQPGNDQYLAATDVTRSFCAVPAQPTITAQGNTLTSSSATGNQWFLNGTALEGATAQTLVAETDGAYTVVVGSGTCASIPSEAFQITLTATRKAPTLVAVHVYPNPATTELRLLGSALGQGSATITLLDLSGRRVLHQEQDLQAGSLQTDLEVRHLPRGTYLLQIQSRAGSVISRVMLQ